MSRKILYSDTGARIKLIREREKLNQKAFALSLGIKQSWLSELEAGIKYPSQVLVTAIQYRYKINRSWFLFGEGEMITGHISEDSGLYGINIPDEELRDIVKMIDFVYHHGTEDQNASLYGHISRIYNGILRETKGGQGNEGSDREPERFPGQKAEAPGKIQKPA